jgi:hypothetical protein
MLEVVNFGIVLRARPLALELRELPRACRVVVVAYGILVTASMPYFYWREWRSFEKWAKRKYRDNDLSLKDARDEFKTNAEYARAFWAATIVVYAAMLLAW